MYKSIKFLTLFIISSFIFVCSISAAYAAVTFDGSQRFQAVPDRTNHARKNGVYQVSGGVYDGLLAAVLDFKGRRTDSFVVKPDRLDLFTQSLFKRHFDQVVGFVNADQIDRHALTFTGTSTLDTLSFEKGYDTTYSVLFDAPLRGNVPLFNHRGKSKSTQSTRILGTLDASTLVTAVPEPSTWLMMLLGLGGSALTLSRRRRQSSKLS